MINPQRITDYNRSDAELQEFAIFCVCVAGKNAHTTAKAVDKLVKTLKKIQGDELPFINLYNIVRKFTVEQLARLIKECSMGCYNVNALCLYKVGIEVNKNPNFLRKCSVEDLEKINGIGSKTARFFILHSRPNQRICAVDTHILKLLREINIPNVPKTTPTKGSKAYARLENAFLDWCDQNGVKDYAAADLANWNKYSLDGLKEDANILA